jgi:hypothetical protein
LRFLVVREEPFLYVCCIFEMASNFVLLMKVSTMFAI